MNENARRDEIFLLTTSGDTPAQVDELCQAAPIVWTKLYGVSRQGGAHQRHRGGGGSEPVQGSVKAFKQTRRLAVDNLVEEVATAGRLGEPGGGAPAAHGGGAPAAHGGGAPAAHGGGEVDAWTEAHEAEKNFQRKKHFKRALQAMQEGALLPAEQTTLFGSEEAAQVAAAASSYLQSKKISTYVRKQALKRLRRSIANAPTFQDVLCGKRVYVDGRLVAAVLGAGALDRTLADNAASAEPVREKAQCFLVPDLSSPGQRVLLNAGLSGGTLLSPKCVSVGAGPFVTYQRALAVRRKVWFSDAFKATHATLMNVFLVRLADVAAGPVRWAVIADRGEFARLAHRNRRGPTALLAFIAKDEVADVDLRNTKRLVAGELLRFLAHIDRNNSSTAMCSK